MYSYIFNFTYSFFKYFVFDRVKINRLEQQHKKLIEENTYLKKQYCFSKMEKLIRENENLKRELFSIKTAFEDKKFDIEFINIVENEEFGYITEIVKIPKIEEDFYSI